MKNVYYSADGYTWVRAPDPPWSERCGHSSVVFDDKMWVLGGAYARSDVWYSADGETWSCATADAAWPGRHEHTTVVLGGKMWVLGGEAGCGGNEGKFNDVWWTEDGVDWVQTIEHASWYPRSGHTSVVFDDRIWVMGGEDERGNDLNDVWCSEPVSCHSADTGRDWAISLSELSRLITLYNARGYRVDSTTKDGYAPYPGPQAGAPHDSDFDPQDWAISIPEISRLVTFYNAGAYAHNPATPDGFEPRP